MLAVQLAPFACCDMAADGNEAVAKFETALDTDNPNQVIFLDIVMPNLDGHGAAKAIRHLEEHRGIKVENGVSIIVLSSLSTPQDIIQAYVSAQSAAHLVKPVKPEKLIKTLRSLELIAEEQV